MLPAGGVLLVVLALIVIRTNVGRLVVQIRRMEGATDALCVAVTESSEPPEIEDPGASELEVKLRWVDLWYGTALGNRLRHHLASRVPRVGG